MEQYGLHRNLQRKNRAVGVAARNGGGHAGCTAVGTGYRKYAGEQPYLCNGSRDSHRERIARRGDRLHRGGNGPDKEPGRNIPPASNYRRGGCGKPNAPGRYAYRLEHGDAQTGKKCGDPARRLRTGHCATLAGGLPAARFPRTLRHLDRQDAARAARSGLAHG